MSRKRTRKKNNRRRRTIRKRRKKRQKKRQRGGSRCHELHLPRGGMEDTGLFNQTNGGYYKGLNLTTCHPNALDSTMASEYFPAKGGGIQKGGFFFPSNLAELGSNIKEIMTNTYNRLGAENDVVSSDVMDQKKIIDSMH